MKFYCIRHNRFSSEYIAHYNSSILYFLHEIVKSIHSIVVIFVIIYYSPYQTRIIL